MNINGHKHILSVTWAHKEFAWGIRLSGILFNRKYMKLTKFGILGNKTTSLFTSIRDSKISRGVRKFWKFRSGGGVNFEGRFWKNPRGGGSYGKSLPWGGVWIFSATTHCHCGQNSTNINYIYKSINFFSGHNSLWHLDGNHKLIRWSYKMSLYGKKINKLITRTLFAIDKIIIAIIMIILFVWECHVCIVVQGIIITLLQFFFPFFYKTLIKMLSIIIIIMIIIIIPVPNRVNLHVERISWSDPFPVCRWRLVIHGGNDRYSRLVVYLKCSEEQQSWDRWEFVSRCYWRILLAFQSKDRQG